ncbi:MAG: 6-bladed beta-propeller [Bacteroidota bacterium]|nr:6-bladed beta-propeller [Bacteroidota bacterium]
MYTLRFLFCSILFVQLISCTNKEPAQVEPEVIEIDIGKKNRPLLNVSIKDLIPLEFSKNSILEFPDKVVCYNNHFYVLNNNRFKDPSLFLFDERGHFKKKTKIGKGPGEMVEPFAFAINKEDSVILIHDMATGRINNFDSDLNYIGCGDHDRHPISDFYHIRNDTFLGYKIWRNRDTMEENQYYTYTLYTEGFTIAKHLDIFIYGNKGQVSLLGPVNVTNDEVLFVSPWSYNIYQLVKGQPTIKYIVDFGRYNFTADELEKQSSDELWKQIHGGKRIGILIGLAKTDDFLVITTVLEEKGLIYFLSLGNKELYCLNDCVEAGSLPDCLISGVTNDGTLYGVVMPDDLKQFQESSGLYQEIEVDEDDNPYVILFKVLEPE